MIYQKIIFKDIKRGLNDSKKGKYSIIKLKSFIVDTMDIMTTSVIKMINNFFVLFDFKLKKLIHKIRGINGHVLPKKW